MHELEWKDPKSLQFLMKKVKFCCSFPFFENNILINLVEFSQVNTVIPTLWITKDVSSEAELDLLFSEVCSHTSSLLNPNLFTEINLCEVITQTALSSMIPGQHTDLLLQLRKAAFLLAKETQ